MLSWPGGIGREETRPSAKDIAMNKMYSHYLRKQQTNLPLLWKSQHGRSRAPVFPEIFQKLDLRATGEHEVRIYIIKCVAEFPTSEGINGWIPDLIDLSQRNSCTFTCAPTDGLEVGSFVRAGVKYRLQVKVGWDRYCLQP